MRGWQIDDAAAAKLVVAEIPRPVVAAGEVLIRVKAAGVTPTELVWYPTTHLKSGEKRSHAVPGHEFSGTVEAIGAETGGVQAGEAIYGMNDWFADGATAEYCVTRVEWIALKPKKLTFAEAASVPIGALTAWQGLFDRANLQKGERVLIHGGAGAVGVFAIQFAHRAGAHVSTTASERSREFLLRLGADDVIDYRTERFEDRLKNVDVVFDCVGGETLERSWGVLGPSGRMVTIAADSEGNKDERRKSAFFIVEARREQLKMMGTLLDAGEIVPVVDSVVPFEKAGEAYMGAMEGRQGRGKVVVSMGE